MIEWYRFLGCDLKKELQRLHRKKEETEIVSDFYFEQWAKKSTLWYDFILYQRFSDIVSRIQTEIFDIQIELFKEEMASNNKVEDLLRYC